MRRFGSLLTAVLVAGLLAPAASAPAAHASLGPPESYLFVVDAADVRVVPEKGTAARIVLTDPSALRFSDRPYRHVRPMSLRDMLAEFGWTPERLKLEDPTPNASISIAGQRSRIVEIRKAHFRQGKLILHVLGIDGPLKSARGAGSVFIDNVSDHSASVALTPDVTATVTFITTGWLEFAVTVDINGKRYATLSQDNPTSHILTTVSGPVPTDLDLTVSLQFTNNGATVSFKGYAITDSPTPVQAIATISLMI